MRVPAAGILRTTAFRVAAVYAIVYAVLTGTIVALVLSLAKQEIYVEVQGGIVDETTALTSLLQGRGPQELRQIIRIRTEHEPPAGEVDRSNPDRRYYLLATAGGRLLVGDLERWPEHAPEQGWYRFNAAPYGPALGLVTPLPDGTRLLVAQSLSTPEAMSAAIGRWVGIAAVLALLAGLVGGLAVGARVMRQIRLASRTAERIRAGRLSERLPVSGASEQSELARAFNAMLERIETAVLGLRDLAARTAHEMKHPLTRTDQALARAQTLEDIGAVRREIATSREEIADLSRRIDALLRLARIEAGAAREFFGELDLARLVADVVELYAPLAEEAGLEIRLDRPPQLPFTGDRQLLAQAVANLLDNATRYAAGGRPIAVRLTSGNGSRIVEVTNLDTATAQRHATRARSERGAGLGLPITRAIARLHGGDLELENEGGLFLARLRLPANGGSPGVSAPG